MKRLKGASAFGFPIGLVLIHNGRRIRLVEDLGDWVLRFADVETGQDYLIACDTTKQLLNPTIHWILEEKEAGRLLDPDADADVDGRRRTFMGLDKSACIHRDPKSAWRFRWAWAALKDGPDTTSDNSFKNWIASRPDLIPDDKGNKEATPKASSVRRWVRKLKAAKGKRGALVSCAGRLSGQSQLPALEDWLVHEATLYHWAAEDAKVIDAGVYYLTCRDAIVEGDNEELKAKLGPAEVRLETIRKRVRQLESKTTVEAKEGARRAKRMFDITGESVPTERFLERVYMDGIQLRQIVTFSDDWPVPSGSMKCVICIDDFTHFVPPPSIFSGPYREDQSLLALMNIMTPPVDLTPEAFAENPWRNEAWGTLDTLVPDNAKSLISPGQVSALGELGPTLELPQVYHHDGKALVENLGKFIKGFLEGLPGTVRGPRHPKDPTRNAVTEAELTRAQLRYWVLEAIRIWNETQRDYLGGLSPLELVQACIQNGEGPKRNPPGEVRRALSKTHDDVIVTREGVEFDGIVYKSDEFGEVLSANYSKTGFKDRLDGTSKIRASIRTFEGDLYEIEVYDEARRKYVVGRAVDAEYAAGLSRWEHEQFKAMMAAKRPQREIELSGLRERQKLLRQSAIDMPKASLKVANRIAALLERDEVRRASGARAHSPGFGELIGQGLLANSAAGRRTDVPKPVHVPGNTLLPKPPAPPQELIEVLSENTPSATPDEEEGEFVWPDLPEDEEDDE